jgi:hypothetical protein
LTSTLAQLLDELADTIRNAIVQTTDVDVQVEPRMVLDPSPPCIDMYPGDPSTDPETAAFGDIAGGEFVTVRARVSTADHEAGQDLLLAFMDDGTDPLSIGSAISDDPTLNGRAQVDYQGRGGYALFPVPAGDGALLGCLWTVRLIKMES